MRLLVGRLPIGVGLEGLPGSIAGGAVGVGEEVDELVLGVLDRDEVAEARHAVLGEEPLFFSDDQWGAVGEGDESQGGAGHFRGVSAAGGALSGGLLAASASGQPHGARRRSGGGDQKLAAGQIGHAGGEAALQPVAVEEVTEPEPFVINDDFDNELAGLLPQVKTDEVAKSRYLEILDIMGSDDPRTVGHRRKLTAQLF